MMIIDPVTLGDVACTRASVKYVYDRTGTLVQVPANTLGVTYDPSDLTKAPYPLIEGPAANYVLWSEDFNDASWTGYWQKPVLTKSYPAPDGTNNATRVASTDGAASPSQTESGLIAVSPGSINGVITVSIWARCTSGTMSVAFGVNDSNQSWDWLLTTEWRRLSYTTSTAVSIAAGDRLLQIHESIQANVEWEVWGAQAEQAAAPSSYIKTVGAPASRVADVIASGAGLVYSNVPIAEPPYSGAATYGLGAVVYDPATYLTYQSLIANNTGKALTDTASWTPLLKAVNRWLMLDQYNNTQTSNPEEIIIVVSPQALAQGIFLGNVDASDVRISCLDLTDGLVYQETQSMVVSNSGSSFYNWSFKRIKRKSYAVSVQLPPYATALVTIAIKKPGGTAKCGVCAIGPLIDIGLAQYGLSREIKDYSTVNFNFDGTSNVIKRNFAKVMDVDLVIDNDQIDNVIETLESYRQKPVAWIGTALYGAACVFGTYTSFKNVIQYPTQSAMSLQIQGTV